MQKKLSAVMKEKESITLEMNALKLKLDKMIDDREKIVQQVEAEEEYLTNALSKRLEAVSIEKESLEKKLADLTRNSESCS